MEPVSATTLAQTMALLELDPSAAAGVAELPIPVGCESCRGLGYRGRVGVFEILRVSEHLHDLIVKRESARAIRRVALKHGMQTLGQSGWKQIRGNLTSLEEIVRVVSVTDAG